MLRELLRWWMARMRELAPARDSLPDALVVTLPPSPSSEPQQVELFTRQRRQLHGLGRFSLESPGLRAAVGRQRRPVVLRVPPALLLQRPVQLPLAAERELTRVLQYDLDRLTPFAPEELFWNARVARRDRVHGVLDVALAVVPRAALAPVIATLTGFGAAPWQLEIDAAGSAVRVIELEPTLRAREARRRTVAVASALCGALAVIALALPFVLQEFKFEALDREIAALRPAVTEANALRQRLSGASAGSDVIAAEAARVGDPLHTLAVLTDLLPDDTYLTDLTLRQRKLTMSGRSAAAARLIGALAADPALRNPSFAAPVTLAPATATGSARVELFSIRSEVAP